MLKFLNISNLAVIRELSVQFHGGLNLLTGETGAGKSIIIDALNLLGGERATTELIRTGERRAVVEGEFASDNDLDVRRILEAANIEFDDDQIVIRREVLESGRSRVFVNEQMTTLTILKSLASHLFEIHGQGEQYALATSETQLELLDDFAGLDRRGIAEAYTNLKHARQRLEEFERNYAEQVRMRDYLAYQLKEIENIAPRPAEDEALEAERTLLSHAEKAFTLSGEAYAELYESDRSILDRLAVVRRRIEELLTVDRRVGQTFESIEAASALLSDVAEHLRDYGAGIDFSSQRIEEVENRLAELEKLKRRYGTNLKEICELRNRLEEQLAEIDDATPKRESLNLELQTAREHYLEVASKLSAVRRKAAKTLEERVMDELKELAMERARFAVNFTAREKNEADFADWTRNGFDRIEFLLSANEGETARSLAKVASGGELSRLMLTLRTLSRRENSVAGARTLIFDEIDNGISGRVAEAVGRRLQSLAEKQQILCVTHQPQIARFADHHFRVTKNVRQKRTLTEIEELDREGRIGELSNLIGGAKDAQTTRDAARWLLDTARNGQGTTGEKSK
jgi:DNA repair protein RecN (Recombination protein N)